MTASASAWMQRRERNCGASDWAGPSGPRRWRWVVESTSSPKRENAPWSRQIVNSKSLRRPTSKRRSSRRRPNDLGVDRAFQGVRRDDAGKFLGRELGVFAAGDVNAKPLHADAIGFQVEVAPFLGIAAGREKELHAAVAPDVLLMVRALCQ